jgi:hypothetical protein
MKDKKARDQGSGIRDQARQQGRGPDPWPEQVPQIEPDTEPDAEPVKGLAGLRRGASQGKGKPAPSTAGAGDADDALDLPEGALVAMRRSGGLRFTSRAVVVYPDGKVEVRDDAAPGSPAPKPARKLSDQDLAQLYRALDEANFPELPPTSGRQSPDAFAYDIAARIGSRTYAVEAFDGSIPASLAPLVQLLARFMRSST